MGRSDGSRPAGCRPYLCPEGARGPCPPCRARLRSRCRSTRGSCCGFPTAPPRAVALAGSGWWRLPRASGSGRRSGPPGRSFYGLPRPGCWRRIFSRRWKRRVRASPGRRPRAHCAPEKGALQLRVVGVVEVGARPPCTRCRAGSDQSRMTPSSRLYSREPVVMFSDPQTKPARAGPGRAKSTRIVFA